MTLYFIVFMENFFLTTFGTSNGARLLEQRQDTLLLRIEEVIGQQRTAIGPLFGVMEAKKKKFNVAEYAVTPTSLEQIFNQFVIEQVGEDDFY